MAQGAEITMDSLNRLIQILKERSVRQEKVILASGRESDFYVDARQTTLNAEGAALIAELVIERLNDDIVAVGGPVTGADPISGAIAAQSWHVNRPVHGFMVRKEPKGHGMKLWVEGLGNIPKGSKVCIVEDTVTTGGSLLTAAQKLEDCGLVVSQIIVVVDREEGALERISSAGYSFEPLTTKSDLL